MEDEDKYAIPYPSPAVKGEQWEFEFIANLLFGENPRPVFIEYEPGNATCYRLLIVPVQSICEVGRSGIFSEGECVVTWLRYSKSYTFTLGYTSCEYLAIKLGIENPEDALQITTFLNRIAAARSDATAWRSV